MSPQQHTIPTPFPVGAVHCYSFERDDELILVDCGPPTTEARDYLQQHIDLERLQHVLITHCHIDHYGQAAWLQREHGCTIYLPRLDALKMQHYKQCFDGMETILVGLGFSSADVSSLRAIIQSDKVLPQLDIEVAIIEEDLPEHFAIDHIACPGHSQTDLIFSADDWAITGDTMLRDTFQSPLLDIDLQTMQRFCNYNAYCQTILNLATLRDKQIFPGHHQYIVGVDYNICFYTGKLLERAARIGHLIGRYSAPEIVEQLFGDAAEDLLFKFLKVSEIVLIGDLIAQPQRLKHSLQQVGLFSQLEDAFIDATGKI